ncbi:hypothetical protein, variant 3 [Cryptococcus amylolentus CBS 6039]|uniref:Uncharacterized protein n=1 Tax=Cryptococcus amylolentus CBS 6039 TaxID=1295533 RepID=A0A1E3HCD4_9TREE|nr:hypothetical protein L202_07488 [Cryptococcus amylolentus CBS 6039]XP_018989863.1 hypothetical protein, variant 1 [Cryptococcus amylolentus CBS 6039]XP_018989864.1 hypothetical protein, variant 2 [Cryptococcus amylolentus CBS 6039]XP_018989865.1 hypothetical protein, variant 3 [Cryptococcus amylolentus CBS 6039]ODN74000.1 hypothetical protein L202_07488 [Cryptococcus amylolentus CBS 6039]ODN74001.1 hypothetical protein, variant 1 [Cryptococcus amylolentus CBS 6039]ODN74002.1 hypothetical p
MRVMILLRGVFSGRVVPWSVTVIKSLGSFRELRLISLFETLDRPSQPPSLRQPSSFPQTLRLGTDLKPIVFSQGYAKATATSHRHLTIRHWMEYWVDTQIQESLTVVTSLATPITHQPLWL